MAAVTFIQNIMPESYRGLTQTHNFTTILYNDY